MNNPIIQYCHFQIKNYCLYSVYTLYTFIFDLQALITTSKTKTRKYDSAYLTLSFISTIVGNKERAQCVLYLKILASDSMKLKSFR